MYTRCCGIIFRQFNMGSVCLSFMILGGGGWCLTLLSTIFQLYRGGRFCKCMRNKVKMDLPKLIKIENNEGQSK